MRHIFNIKVNLAVSAAMFVLGITIAILNWPLNILGADEPRLIFQMSAAALWVSGYGNIVVAVMRDENAPGENTF